MRANDMGRVYADHLDTSRRVATNDSDAEIVWKWESKPFGESKATGDITFNLRFPGQYFDAETGTHYNINRDYNPVTGRYIQRDPIGFDGGVNGYLYANGNSLIYKDLNGLVATVEYNSNNVRITLSIAFIGGGVSPTIIERFKSGIEKKWSGTFGKYNVQTLVHVETSGSADNIITIPSKNISISGRSEILGRNSGTWFKDESGLGAAHEAGHLMGLDDKYSENPISGGPSLTWSGWHDNIMGDLGKVDERNINEILANGNGYNTMIAKDSTFKVEPVGINIFSTFLIFLFSMFIPIFFMKQELLNKSAKKD